MPLTSSIGALRPVAACVAAAAVTCALPAWALTPFVLQDIRVEGLQRTDPGTVFAALPFRVGDTYDEARGAAAVRALFATGLFSDVRLEIDGRVVVIVVEERPLIGAVRFAGMREFEAEVILRALRDAGIAEGLPFDRALLDRAEQEIRRQYLARSLYGAEVVATVSPAERNRVDISFNVVEGDVARIREIRIVGNTAFSERTLLGLFQQTTPGWLTWYTRADRYSRARLEADLETLRAHYTNRGYLDFAIESTEVTISPDKADITITVTIREGQQFFVTGVRLEGDFLGRDDEFKSLVRIRPGEPYRAQDVADTQRLFAERFGLYGYAFARIEARPEIDRANGRVVVVLAAQPQQRVYVRRIHISGNLRTRDEVIRREMRQFESAWYDGARIRLSRDRIDRLGFFTEVGIDTEEVPGTPDQVDLHVRVVEKPTGALMLGAGFSSAEGLTLSASIRQENIFGTGHFLGLELNTSRFNRNFSLSTVDPYFTVDGVSRAIDVYYRTTRPIGATADTYRLISAGGALRFGVPFTERDTVFFGAGVESTRIEGGAQMPNSWFLYRERYGEHTLTVPLTVGWARDTRDSALVPTTGRLLRANLEASVAGDARFARTSLQAQQFLPLGARNTLGLNAELGWGASLDQRAYPFFKNYFGGGLGSVRGFAQGSLGPVDVTGVSIGGPRKLNLNAEFYTPVPGTGADRTLRLFGFVDAGNVWGEDERVSLASMRVSAGVGLSWISPIGPLKISYGVPVRKERNDTIQRFQFQIGTAF